MTELHQTHNTHHPALCCGHCGTSVRPGYTVCSACGANYRRRGLGIFIPAILAFALANAVSAGRWDVALVCGILLAWMIRRSRQFLWYRRNA